MAVDILHESNGDFTIDIHDASSSSASNYRDGELLTTLTGSAGQFITDGSYDSGNIELGTFRNTTEILDLWRTE
jgi:hypothetical protein